ncbi:hypothetical protein Poli38472_010698 [Pythium oligandrum]|uniref:Serine aminopeptidase S33 domain-containing protein n=1 Tax=Pythium oligandrum TaxID=41045 RepID=A0A8K1FFG7_PYTOL|nr:hypothetical protein Poli38472_010698 [Pythium oligandrum]|eukprot:TMW61635.1 hypothetical protein Poli38472_010698 [Pythium oligandrum]
MTDSTSWRVLVGSFHNTRSQSLAYYASFPQANVPLRGVVFFLHGIGEYARRFTHLFDVLGADGFGVIAYDMIGHGRSDDDYPGQRAHAERFQHMVDDTNAFLTFAKETIYPKMLGNAPHPPLIFMAISYGTLVGLHTVLSERHHFAGIMLAAPAVSVEWTCFLKFQYHTMRPLGELAPHSRITPGVNYKCLSRNPEFVADFLADPLVIKLRVTSQMAVETPKAMNRLRADTRPITATSSFCQIPIIFLHGSEDKVTSVPLSEEFFHSIASRDKTYEKLQGLYHCIFNEPEKEQVMNKVVSWLNARFPLTEDKFLTLEDLRTE